MAGVLTETPQTLFDDNIETSIKRATSTLLASQKDEGHWIYELEADVTLTAQYVMLAHFLGEPPNILLEQKISRYLRRLQQEQGGWPLYTGGPLNINTSVQAYLALRLIGDPPSAEHMTRACSAILRAGGAEASNVFTRVLLALFGVIPWDVIPMIPVEAILLPQWFPFHVSNISFWARTALVPLMILRAEQPVRPVVGIKELFHCKPEEVGPLPPSLHQSAAWFSFFQAFDKALRLVEPIKPAWLKRHAIDKAVRFVDERVETDIGLGGAFIMTMNAVIMYDVLGRPHDDPKFTIARDYIEHLLVVREDEAYCQLCDSPVWDTVLAAYALLETGDSDAELAARRGLDWLRGKQITEVRGDWAWHRPQLRPGGWAFQYENPYYPDVDDTAVVVVAMQRADRLNEERTSHPDRASTSSYSECISRATEWVLGMQTSVGGWGAFEPENTNSFLENVPFTEFGALLFAPTSDVTGRCISMLAGLTSHDVSKAQQRAIDFLLAEQEPDGSWYGRWGVNYTHGTWSALGALNAVGFPLDDERIRRAVGWLLRVQNEDGGWGEDGGSYALDHCCHEWAPSTPTQTAWALLGLMAAGEGDHSAVAQGVRWLVGAQREDGAWEEEAITGTAFPRMFYLRYHGYPSYFPLWALARYRNLKRDGLKRVELAL
nr:PREDICTED: uncharacterized protein LOC109036910 [Bemisia tabaci]